MSTFFKSQFSYFSLSWMFHSCTLNNKLNRLHERWLSIIYNDNASSLTDLLEINSSVSLHQRNIQIFATKLYKFVNGFSLKLVSDCFKLNNMTVYNTRNRSSFYFWPLHSLTWHRVTLPLGTKKLGTCVNWYEKPFNSHNLEKSHDTMEATCLSMSALWKLHLLGWFHLPSNTKPTFSS